MGINWDAVLNHKMAGDKKEKCLAVEEDPNDRTKDLTEPYEIEAWLGFDFPGRGEANSKVKYHWYHFSGTDYNAANSKTAIYRITGNGKYWSPGVDRERGDYDCLMGCDLDYAHPEVQDDVKNWGGWIGKEVPLRGIRFDAIKHFSKDFLKQFIQQIDKDFGDGWFFVGEVCSTLILIHR